MTRFVIYEERKCYQCNGVGRVLTAEYLPLIGAASALVNAINEKQDPAYIRGGIRRVIQEGSFLKRAEEEHQPYPPITRVCPQCEGKGRTYTPVELTPKLLQELIATIDDERIRGNE